METTPKFNMRKCLDYINDIEDFTIEFERKPSMDVQSKAISYMSELISIKVSLRRFLIECKKESSREEYDFIQWLNDRKLFWRSQQYRIVGALTDRADMLKGADKAEIEKKKQSYLNFFLHNYKLIDRMETDVLNSLEVFAAYLPEGGKTDTAPSTQQTFDTLFKEGIDAEAYYQLLRDHEYPLMGKDYNYVSKALKSGFCIWIYELQRQNIIKHQTDKVYAKLLLNKISGLRAFDESMFRKTNNKADNRYKEYFSKKVTEVKQAQDSQSAHL